LIRPGALLDLQLTPPAQTCGHLIGHDDNPLPGLISGHPDVTAPE